jgi:hypothetical protein
MDIDSAISARYAEYGPDGTLVLVGAGLSGVMSQPLPTAMPQPGGVAAVGTPVYFFVAVRVTFDRSELSSSHTMQVQITAPSGAVAFATPTAPLMLTDVPFVPPGVPLAMQFPVSCGFAPPAFGPYTVSVSLNGVVRKQLVVLVVQPPQNYGSMSTQG